MPTLIQLPDDLARELETLAAAEGITSSRLIERMVTEVLAPRLEQKPNRRREVPLPLIPKSETGTIPALTGKDIDEILSREDIAS